MDASQLISGPDPYEDERYNPDERKKDDEGIEDGKDTDPTDPDKPAPETNPEDEGGSPVVVILIIIVVILIVGGVAFRCK